MVVACSGDTLTLLGTDGFLWLAVFLRTVELSLVLEVVQQV